jgi:hypothetical protein
LHRKSTSPSSDGANDFVFDRLTSKTSITPNFAFHFVSVGVVDAIYARGAAISATWGARSMNIQSTIDQSLWDRSLTADGLRSSMWLYAYESALKSLNSTGSKSHVTTDPYFGPLLALNIEFYRSDWFHMNRNALLARLRLERAREQIQ